MMRFLCALVLLGVASGFEMPELFAKYSMTGQPGVDSFFSVPRTEKDAVALKWVVPEETKGDTLFKTICNPVDYRICVLYDNLGSICGYQISIPAKVGTLQIPGFDYLDKGFKELTLFGQNMYSNQIFFVSQEVIADGGREYDGQTGTGLYLQVADQLLETPRHETLMNTTLFNRQNCFPRMGQHYFYDVRTNLTQEEFFPWFTLFDHDGNLNGFGFISFGSFGKFEKSPFAEDAGSWIENVPAMAIKMIAPDVPQWVLDYCDKYGVYSHHMYFTANPWQIKCKASEDKLAGRSY